MHERRFDTEACWAWAVRGPFGSLALLALLGLALAGCRADEARDVAFQRVLPLCNEYFRPASMAPPGSAAGAHQDDLSRQIRAHAAEFNTPAGVRYLLVRLQRERDDAARACIRRLLDDLREGAA